LEQPVYNMYTAMFPGSSGGGGGGAWYPLFVHARNTKSATSWSFMCVYHCDIQSFVEVSKDTHGLLLRWRWHLVQLACAVCVGQQCLPSVQSLPIVVPLGTEAGLPTYWPPGCNCNWKWWSSKVHLHEACETGILERAAECLVNFRSQGV